MAATTQALYDAVCDAILTGVDKPGTISRRGTTITYHSLADLRELRDTLKAELDAASAATATVASRRTFASFRDAP